MEKTLGGLTHPMQFGGIYFFGLEKIHGLKIIG